jgi:hypothetical protein
VLSHVGCHHLRIQVYNSKDPKLIQDTVEKEGYPRAAINLIFLRLLASTTQSPPSFKSSADHLRFDTRDEYGRQIT